MALYEVPSHTPSSHPVDDSMTFPATRAEGLARLEAFVPRGGLHYASHRNADLDRAVGFSAHIPQRRLLQPDRTKRQMTHILEALGTARSLSEYSLDQMLAQETQYFARGTTLILVTSSPESAWVARAKRLSQRGVKAMCIYLDPTTFNPLIRAEDVRRSLRASGIPTLIIRCGEDLSHALGQKSQ